MKIWGVSYGLTGDLIMGLPVLHYYARKYPGSYKIWAIEKKVGYMAPFFLNHELIDHIRITGQWDGFDATDYAIADYCDIRCTLDGWKHSRLDWYNYTDCIDETAYIAGVKDLDSVISEEQRYPELFKWFDVGMDDPYFNTYSKSNGADVEVKDDMIALFPFATANSNIARSPSPSWYNELVEEIQQMGYGVYQFGYKRDYRIEGVLNFTHLTFFDQVRLALSTRMSIGTDSGNMWVMGAYSHPAVHLMTNWMVGHKQNFEALTPMNRNGLSAFAEGGANNIEIDHVLAHVRTIMEDKK